MAPAECFELLPTAISDTVKIRLCERVDTAGPGICSRFRGLLRDYGPRVMSRLCDRAQGQGPAECFYRSALVAMLSLDERVDLCKGALTDAPARYNTQYSTTSFADRLRMVSEPFPRFLSSRIPDDLRTRARTALTRQRLRGITSNVGHTHGLLPRIRFDRWRQHRCK